MIRTRHVLGENGKHGGVAPSCERARGQRIDPALEGVEGSGGRRGMVQAYAQGHAQGSDSWAQ